MMHSRWFAVLGFLALLFLALPAAAQQPSPDDLKKAEEHFKKGAEWYVAGEYAKAIVEFKFGHRLAPNAMFLYNMSLAYERLQSYEEAAGVAQEARKMGGMPDEITVRNEARLTAFEVILDAQAVATSAKAVAQDDQQVKDDDVIKDEQKMTIERADGIKTIGYIGIGLAAVGGGLVLGGFVTNESVKSDITDFRNAATQGDRATYDSLAESIPNKQRTGKLLYAMGAAAVGVGFVLFVTDIFVGTEEVPIQVSVAPSPEGAWVGARMTFR